MPMPPYPVRCYAPRCEAPAAYKIAARWSDGTTKELKTYFLACPECLKALYAEALVRRKACRLSTGETLEEPGIYDLHRGERDRTLKRRTDLELAAAQGPNPGPSR